MTRRILRLDGGAISVAQEARFDSEAQLHSAIAAHPEVLPAEDVGVGPLVALASELDLGAGPMDLLATDGNGRLVIVEFKRGTENPDVRKVVAQVLDYGSTLWRFAYEELERRCQACKPTFQEPLDEHVGDVLRRLGETYDEDSFRAGITRCLDAGSFVFMYVGRDLDERTRRIMTFLAEGARMTFFAVEVDQFHAGDAHTSVLVPRTAFVPSWVNTPVTGITPVADPETLSLMGRMDELASELKLHVDRRRTGRVYLPATLEPVPNANSGVGVYASQRGMEINLSIFRAYGEDATAAGLLAALGAATHTNLGTGYTWPSVKCEKVNENWDRVRSEVFIPYFQARLAHANATPRVILDQPGANGGSGAAAAAIAKADPD